MKNCFKYSLIAVFTVVLAAPGLVSAQSVGNQATIDSLFQQIQALQVQINTLKQTNVSTPSVPQQAIAIPQNIPSFNRNLFFGIRGDDVRDLQEFLTDQGYYAGPISSYYGLLTVQAVKKFQSANGINPTGYFGPKSRAIASEIFRKLVSQICSEEGCEGDVLPVEKLKISTDSDLRGMVRENFTATFRASGGSGNYSVHPEGGIPGLNWGASACEVSKECRTEQIILSGTPVKSGVYYITIFAKDESGAYGKERFTVVISDKTTTVQPPIISGIKGPTTLKVGEEGLWTINAYDPNNGNLSYRVVWGDEEFRVGKEGAPAQHATPFTQTAAFSHIYYKAGIYHPVFYIVSFQGGQEAKTSISVNVGEVTSTTVSEQVKCVFNGATTEQKCWGDAPSPTVGNPTRFSCTGMGTCVVTASGQKGTPVTWGSSCGGSANTVIDGNNEYANFSCASTQPSIQVLSPNGGEAWQKGSAYALKWAATGDTTKQLRIELYDTSYTGAYQNPVSLIANYVSASNGSYTWTIPGDQSVVSPGSSYKIVILRAGEPGEYDRSDTPFSIINASGSAGSSISLSLVSQLINLNAQAKDLASKNDPTLSGVLQQSSSLFASLLASVSANSTATALTLQLITLNQQSLDLVVSNPSLLPAIFQQIDSILLQLQNVLLGTTGGGGALAPSGQYSASILENIKATLEQI